MKSPFTTFILLSLLIGQQVLASPGDGASVTASNSGPLTCNRTIVTLNGPSSPDPGVTYTWTGTGNVSSFTATGISATVTRPGTYILTATNPSTGSTSTASTTVVQQLTVPTGVSAAHVGTLTCSNNIVDLSGSSTTSLAVTYAWTGPGGFTASGATTTASTPGIYTIIATYTPTGCTASANTTVSRIFTAPGQVTAVASGALTCNNASVALEGSSDNPAATYTWTGPNGFTASGASVTASAVGTYTMTAANVSSSFGCTATTTVSVVQNLTVPASVTATASDSLTCSNASVTLTGSSASGANFTWTGPGGYTASGTSVTTTTAGTYMVTATDPTSGCTATASSVVTQNTTAPGGVTTTAVPATAQVTCSHPTILLTGSSTTTGVTYSWSGPGIVSSSGASATVNLAGTYTVTVTDPTNGCFTTLLGAVTKNVSVPIGLTASSGDVISCFTPTIDLQGGSSTPGVTFLWSGPGGYTANTAVAETSVPGNYTLTVTDPINGCFSEATTTVIQNTTGCSSAVPTAPVSARAEGFNIR